MFGSIESTLVVVNIFAQRLPDWIAPVMRGASFLGTEPFYLTLIPFLYWFVSRAGAVRMLVALLSSAYVNCIFKWIFSRPRPFWFFSDVRPLAEEATYGIPSGHAQNALVVWFLLAITLAAIWPQRKKLLFVVTALVVFVISFSRLYLGVHFLEDTLMGWFLGAIILILTLRLSDGIETIFKNPAMKALFLLLPVLLLFIGMYIRSLAPAPVLPPSLNIDPLKPDFLVGTLGVLFGLILAACLQGEDVDARWEFRLIFFLATIVGLFLIQKGLSSIAPREGDLEQPVRFLRYAMTAIWGFLIVPWSAKKLLS